MRQVTQHQSIGFAPVLVDDDDIREIVRPRRLHQVVDHLPSPVDPCGIGKNQTELLGELRQTRARVAAGGDQDSRLAEGGAAVLVVDRGPGDGGVVVLELDGVAEFALVAAELGGDGLALCSFVWAKEKNG